MGFMDSIFTTDIVEIEGENGDIPQVLFRHFEIFIYKLFTKLKLRRDMIDQQCQNGKIYKATQTRLVGGVSLRLFIVILLPKDISVTFSRPTQSPKPSNMCVEIWKIQSTA